MGGPRGRRVDGQKKQKAIDIIGKAKVNGCRIKVACSDLEIDFKSLNRWKADIEDKRLGPKTSPKNKLKSGEKDKIISIATSEEYQNDSPWIIVAKLVDRGIYIASESSFYKVLKERKLLAHRGKSKKATKKRPKALVATGPNQIWTWDITYLKSMIRGQFFYLYLFMDIFSRKIVGYDIFCEEAMENSSQLFENICIDENIVKDQLVLHADNGGPMKGATMLATLQKLGVASSFSRPRVSDDNPYSESLFKTLKYKPDYPDSFSSIDDAKKWVLEFVNWYNEIHLHSGIKFVTPSSRHQGVDVAILAGRKEVYEKAKKKNPKRWGNKKTRNWEREEKVYLNYLNRTKGEKIEMVS